MNIKEIHPKNRRCKLKTSGNTAIFQKRVDEARTPNKRSMSKDLKAKIKRARTPMTKKSEVTDAAKNGFPKLRYLTGR
jgi:hypothetical protein